ncbi:MAG: FixH family protein [Gammaproteobacteria bacterium]
MNTQTIQPWYRQFWPWFLIAFPATAVVAGIATIIIAVKSDDGLVDDDYYKAGLAINRTLERSQVASQLGLNARVRWDQHTGSLTLNLQGKLTSIPARLDMTFLHPTRAHLDKKIKLYSVSGKSSYTGRMELIESGSWHVILEPEDKSWRLKGRINQAQQASWVLQPE